MLEAKFYPWGSTHKELMRTSPMRDHLVGFTMQGEDLPLPTNRIELDPQVKDVHGLPVARTTYHPHQHELVASAFYAPKLEAILAEAGATWARSVTSPDVGSTAQQLAGQARPHPGVTPRDGHDPDGDRPGHVGLRPLGPGPFRAERGHLRLVPVPDRCRLRADAHTGGAGHPKRPGAAGLNVSLPRVLRVPGSRRSPLGGIPPAALPSSVRAERRR